MLIAVTDTMGREDKFRHYVDWLEQADPSVECVRLSYRNDNLPEIESCDALVLTGGHDVNPALYGGDAADPRIRDVDTKRDDFERRALDYAVESALPLLGICRGLQLVNVHLGGTLIPDIPGAGYPSHEPETGSAEFLHPIAIEPGSLLGEIVGAARGEVNSNHHQAVGRPGAGLLPVARSADGMIEAMELAAPFFLLVQWHPERMPMDLISTAIVIRLLSSVHARVPNSNHKMRTQ